MSAAHAAYIPPVGRSTARVVSIDETSSLFRRVLKYNRFPSQKKFDELDTKFKGFSGSIGCIAGETVIDGTGMTVAELHRLQIAPVVQTIYGQMHATVPFIKGRDRLYRVTMQSGRSFLATSAHVVFDREHGWRQLSCVAPGEQLLVSASPLRGSIEAPFQSEYRTGALRCCCKDEGFAVGYRSDCHSGGVPLHVAGGIASSASPSRAGAHEYTHSNSSMDDQACGSAHIHAYLLSAHHSTQNSTRPRSAGGQMGYCASSDALGRTDSLSQSVELFLTAIRSQPPIARSYRDDVRTPNGYQPERRFVPDTPSHVSGLCQSVSRFPSALRLPLPFVSPDHRFEDMQRASDNTQRAFPYRDSIVLWDVIASIEYERTDLYYDLHVPGAEHYFAHGILHHNSGKSKALCFEAIKLAYLNPGVLGLIGAPTYSMLTSSTLIELESTLQEHGIPYKVSRSAGSMQVYLKEPNTTILLRSLEVPERLRGMNLGWFGVDELSYCREEAWIRLQGRLRHPKAKVKRGFAVWTPKGRDWVYRTWIGPDKISNFHCVQARPFENRAILNVTPDFYDNLKLQYDEKFYRQEVLGEYLDMFGGAVYHAFDPTKNVLDNLSFDPSLPLILCLDFNINPMTCVLAQCREMHGRKTVNVLREIALPSSHVIAMCEEIVRRTSDWQRGLNRPLQIEVYGDATGGNPHASSQGETCWSLVEKFFARQQNYRTRFLYSRSNPTVVERVNCVNAMLCSFGDGHRSAGTRSLFIDRRCRELILDFSDVAWKTDAHGIMYPEIEKKKDPKRTHLSDALGYFVFSISSIASRGRVISSGLGI